MTTNHFTYCKARRMDVTGNLRIDEKRCNCPNLPEYSADGKLQICQGCERYISRVLNVCPNCKVYRAARY